MGSICVHSYISKKLPGNFGIQLKVEVSCEGIFYNEQAGRGQAGSAVSYGSGRQRNRAPSTVGHCGRP